MSTQQLDLAAEWARSHSGIVLLGCAGAVAAWLTIQPLRRWRLRLIPGPRGLPFLGSLADLLSKGDVYDCVNFYSEKYPKAWQLWLGAKPHVVITDVELARRVANRFNSRPTLDDLTLRHGENNAAWNAQLLFLPSGAEWRVARKAFEVAVMHSKSLQAQAPFIAQCAERLCARLQRYADSGEPVDVLPLVYSMTLDAVGFAAFGLDLGATSAVEGDVVATVQLPSAGGAGGKGGKGGTAAPPKQAAPPPAGWWDEHPLGSPEFGACMVQCAVGVMRSMSFAAASAWALVPLFLPWAEGAARLLSRVLPDKPMVEEKEYFDGLKEACKVIMRTWHEQHASAAAAGAGVISEQGFVSRLLSDKAKGAGEEDSMTDLQMVANAIGMVVTGYETTGASVASTLHFLSRNPEVQRKLQQEVDQVLGGKAPTQEDLERMPYLNAVFMEALRLRPPANALVRHMTDDTWDLGDGLSLPRGTYVFIPSGFFMVDPKIWPRAREFLPERHLQPGNEELAPTNPAAMMPFGAGSRQCVGYKFALQEARTVLARLAQRYTFSPAPGAPDPKFTTSLAY